MENKTNINQQAEKAIEKYPSLVGVNKLSQEFEAFLIDLDHILVTSKAIKIEDDEGLAIVENTYSGINDFLKRLDNKRAIIKAPYFNTGKAIDAYAKLIAEKVETAKKRYNSAITSYKTIQRAAAKAEAEKREQELLEEQKLKQEEIDKINRIRNMIIAKIFGGKYHLKDGSVKEAVGCKTKDECIELLRAVKNNFKPEDFERCTDLAGETFNDLIVKIGQQTNNIITGKTSDTEKEKMLREAAEKEEEAKKELEKETRDSMKESQALIKDAGKGLRETLRYNIVNEKDLDRKFLSADPQKIREYMSENKEMIKEHLKENKQTALGLEFYIETKHVSS
jgi:hypothetical protein